MAQTSINVRMDEELKRKFERFCDEVGMSMSTAITMFAKATIREGKIPFEIKVDPFYSEENIAYLKDCIAEADNGEMITVKIDELRKAIDG